MESKDPQQFHTELQNLLGLRGDDINHSSESRRYQELCDFVLVTRQRWESFFKFYSPPNPIKDSSINSASSAQTFSASSSTQQSYHILNNPPQQQQPQQQPPKKLASVLLVNIDDDSNSDSQIPKLALRISLDFDERSRRLSYEFKEELSVSTETMETVETVESNSKDNLKLKFQKYRVTGSSWAHRMQRVSSGIDKPAPSIFNTVSKSNDYCKWNAMIPTPKIIENSKDPENLVFNFEVDGGNKPHLSSLQAKQCMGARQFSHSSYSHRTTSDSNLAPLSTPSRLTGSLLLKCLLVFADSLYYGGSSSSGNCSSNVSWCSRIMAVTDAANVPQIGAELSALKAESDFFAGPLDLDFSTSSGDLRLNQGGLGDESPLLSTIGDHMITSDGNSINSDRGTGLKELRLLLNTWESNHVSVKKIKMAMGELPFYAKRGFYVSYSDFDAEGKEYKSGSSSTKSDEECLSLSSRLREELNSAGDAELNCHLLPTSPKTDLNTLRFSAHSKVVTRYARTVCDVSSRVVTVKFEESNESNHNINVSEDSDKTSVTRLLESRLQSDENSDNNRLFYLRESLAKRMWTLLDESWSSSEVSQNHDESDSNHSDSSGIGNRTEAAASNTDADAGSSHNNTSNQGNDYVTVHEPTNNILSLSRELSQETFGQQTQNDSASLRSTESTADTSATATPVSPDGVVAITGPVSPKSRPDSAILPVTVAEPVTETEEVVTFHPLSEFFEQSYTVKSLWEALESRRKSILAELRETVVEDVKQQILRDLLAKQATIGPSGTGEKEERSLGPDGSPTKKLRPMTSSTSSRKTVILNRQGRQPRLKLRAKRTQTTNRNFLTLTKDDPAANRRILWGPDIPDNEAAPNKFGGVADSDSKLSESSISYDLENPEQKRQLFLMVDLLRPKIEQAVRKNARRIPVETIEATIREAAAHQDDTRGERAWNRFKAAIDQLACLNGAAFQYGIRDGKYELEQFSEGLSDEVMEMLTVFSGDRELYTRWSKISQLWSNAMEKCEVEQSSETSTTSTTNILAIRNPYNNPNPRKRKSHQITPNSIFGNYDPYCGFSASPDNKLKKKRQLFLDTVLSDKGKDLYANLLPSILKVQQEFLDAVELEYGVTIRSGKNGGGGEFDTIIPSVGAGRQALDWRKWECAEIVRDAEEKEKGV